MLERAAAIAILDQLHAAQNEFYSGGADSSLHRLLAPNIAWTVPGNNSIAGRYRLQIAACWLLPLDQRAFDAIWSIPATPP